MKIQILREKGSDDTHLVTVQYALMLNGHILHTHWATVPIGPPHQMRQEISRRALKRQRELEDQENFEYALESLVGSSFEVQVDGLLGAVGEVRDREQRYLDIIKKLRKQRNEARSVMKELKHKNARLENQLQAQSDFHEKRLNRIRRTLRERLKDEFFIDIVGTSEEQSTWAEYLGDLSATAANIKLQSELDELRGGLETLKHQIEEVQSLPSIFLFFPKQGEVSQDWEEKRIMDDLKDLDPPKKGRYMMISNYGVPHYFDTDEELHQFLNDLERKRSDEA